MKKTILYSLTFSLIINFSLSAREVPSSGEMIAEVLARPIGLAGLVVGAGLFIITIPFGLLNAASTGSMESIRNSGKRLVIAPALFTFARGVGDYPDHMEEIEIVKE